MTRFVGFPREPCATTAVHVQALRPERHDRVVEHSRVQNLAGRRALHNLRLWIRAEKRLENLELLQSCGETKHQNKSRGLERVLPGGWTLSLYCGPSLCSTRFATVWHPSRTMREPVMVISSSGVAVSCATTPEVDNVRVAQTIGTSSDARSRSIDRSTVPPSVVVVSC